MDYIKNLIGNSWLHFVCWLTAYHFAGWIHNLVIDADPNSIGTLWIWFIAVAIMLGILIEINQRSIAIQKASTGDRYFVERDYWKLHWRHSLTDFAMGVAGAVLGLLPFWIG